MLSVTSAQRSSDLGTSARLLLADERFDKTEVSFGVDSDGVVVGGLDVKLETVLQEAKLFQALGSFKGAGRQCREEIERGLAIGVQADVLPVKRGSVVAVVGDRCTREIERSAIRSGDYLDRVRIDDVLRRASDLQGGDIDVGLPEGAQQCGDVFRAEQRFVALDVDVDVRIVKLRHDVEAVGAAGQIGRRELHGDVDPAAEVGDLLRVGGDEDLVELRAGARGIDDPGEQGTAGYLTEEFAGKAG